MIPRSRALDDDDVFLKVAGYKLRARWDLPRLRELTRTLQPEETMMRDSPLNMIRRHRSSLAISPYLDLWRSSAGSFFARTSDFHSVSLALFPSLSLCRGTPLMLCRPSQSKYGVASWLGIIVRMSTSISQTRGLFVKPGLCFRPN